MANVVHKSLLGCASRTLPANVAELAVFWTARTIGCLRRRFGGAGVVELTYQIGVENMRARSYTPLGITEQGFNSGDACRVPWAESDQTAAASR